MFKKFIYFVGLVGICASLGGCDSDFSSDENIHMCGNLSIKTSFAGAKKLTLGIFGQDIKMSATKSDAGISYEGKTDKGQSVVFTPDGDKATISIDTDINNSFDVYECEKIIPNPEKDFISFKSIGHEPDWYFTFNNMVFGFRMMGVEHPIVIPVGEFNVPKMKNGSIKMHITKDNKTVDINIKQKICQDNMTGQFFIYTVQIIYDGNEYNGCGLSLSDPKQSLLRA